jgi:hypothetical protein
MSTRLARFTMPALFTLSLEGSLGGRTLHRPNGPALPARSLEGLALSPEGSRRVYPVFEAFTLSPAKGAWQSVLTDTAKGAFLIETRKRLKIAVTRTNQTTDTHSNRVNFAGFLGREEYALAADSAHGARRKRERRTTRP